MFKNLLTFVKTQKRQTESEKMKKPFLAKFQNENHLSLKYISCAPDEYSTLNDI